MSVLDSVVVGAGQAGLGVSYFLKKKGLEHVVFERGRIGETWLSQRWNSFKLNTPNFMNCLPGLPYEGPEPDGFWSLAELVQYFKRYVDRFELPVNAGVTVISVDQANGEEYFIVKTKTEDQTEELVKSRSVVVACGILQTPKFPEARSRVPDDIFQLHTADYRNPRELPQGAVLVVGSGQSGCQIVEDLLSAGRMAYLCTSKVGRAPRRYRGRDILEWWIDMKFIDVTLDSLEDKSVSKAAQPQISGLGRYGHSLSLQYLAGKGAVILGRLLDVEGNTVITGDDAAAHIHFADEFSQKLKDGIDSYIAQAHIQPPPLEEDPADIPDPEAKCASPIRRLDLGEANISTIIWATGFKGDFGWIHFPVTDDDGQPVHKQGISQVPGLYFMGFPWLNSRKSGIIYGINEDANFIASEVAKHLA
jgi:putative flavoprotein involved in K+ transport